MSYAEFCNAVAKQELSYDAWGKRRHCDTWAYALNIADFNAWHARGFTAHEHLDIFEMINMDGRMYDPVLGRFLSPDPYVQAPDFTQNFNRYSYCLNNPLVYVDEDGEAIFTILSLIFCPALLPMVIQTDIGWISGGLNAKANGGSFLGGALLGGAIGAANGALSMLSPIQIPFGSSGFGLNIAPQISVGSDGIGIGLNSSLGYNFKGFNAGINLGGTYYASAAGTGKSGFEGRLGYGIGYQNKSFQVGIGTNYF